MCCICPVAVDYVGWDNLGSESKNGNQENRVVLALVLQVPLANNPRVCMFCSFERGMQQEDLSSGETSGCTGLVKSQLLPLRRLLGIDTAFSLH